MTSFYRSLGLFLIIALPALAMAQGERSDKTAVTFEELYDEPHNINKLFVHLQPLYGEVFATNVNAGFGLQAQYNVKDKVDLNASFRSTYGSQFFDMNRDQGKRTSETDNRQKPFTYFEIGGTYFIKDMEKSSKTKIVLYKKSYKGNKWAARVPLNAEVPCKVRQIIGARLGATVWQSTIDVNNIMKKQDLTAADFEDETGANLQNAGVANGDDDVTIFSNVSSGGLYVGGSFSWIRNAAFSFDKFEGGVDDLILTTYLDVLIAPRVKVDDIVYLGTPYDISPISVKKIGFRAGVEGKFNRTLSWAYGAEVGYRPGIDGRMFYALVKISFPVFGTNLDYKVESFEKAKQ
ncbi:MAG: hypothetical protein JNJ75_10245 [Cyclobacteriaceae bacterium]|nr:hypothetical protein [Cyclobacteriaceae bacterium]